MRFGRSKKAIWYITEMRLRRGASWHTQTNVPGLPLFADPYSLIGYVVGRLRRSMPRHAAIGHPNRDFHRWPHQSQLHKRVSVLDVGMKILPLGICAHDSVVVARRHAGILVDRSIIELDLKYLVVLIVADRGDVA